MDTIRRILLLIPGVIHLLPVSGVLGETRLAALYGVGVYESNLLILMQHRAVLLGILGLLLIAAAFRDELQRTAIIGGLLSTVSFVVIAVWVGNYNESLGRVFAADIIAILCLLFAAILPLLKRDEPVPDS